MKLSLFFLLSVCAWGQTTGPTSTVNTSALPAYTVGFGPSWDRGAAYPYQLNLTLALHIGTGQWYSYTSVSTPIHTSAPGSQPVASTITTGGAWVAVQSPTGMISLVLIVQAGFSTIQANSTVAPAFSGSLAVPIHIGSGGLFVMPYCTGASATTATSGGALATAVLQPGIQIMYGFSKTPVASAAAKAPTVKMMRAVMRRAGLPESEVK